MSRNGMDFDPALEAGDCCEHHVGHRKAGSDDEDTLPRTKYGRRLPRVVNASRGAPQVFVRGVLIGGEDLTKAAIADGSLKARLAKAQADGPKAKPKAVKSAPLEA